MEKKKTKAVALSYQPEKGDKAPRVVAKGQGEVAKKIIEMARKHGVPIEEDPDLVAFLIRLDISQEIPPELYVAVARILAFVYALKGKRV